MENNRKFRQSLTGKNCKLCQLYADKIVNFLYFSRKKITNFVSLAREKSELRQWAAKHNRRFLRLVAENIGNLAENNFRISSIISGENCKFSQLVS